MRLVQIKLKGYTMEHTNIVSITFGTDFDRIGTTMVYMHGYPIDVVYYLIYDETLRYLLASLVAPLEVDIELDDDGDVISIRVR